MKPTNPYIGPRAFLHGETLYGRRAETTDLLDLLIAERIVLLYSPSGAGKTSLIQAGLLSALEKKRRRVGFQVLPVMRVNQPPPDFPLPEGFNRYAYSALLSLESDEDSSHLLKKGDLQDLARLELLNLRVAREAVQRPAKDQDVEFSAPPPNNSSPTLAKSVNNRLTAKPPPSRVTAWNRCNCKWCVGGCGTSC